MSDLDLISSPPLNNDGPHIPLIVPVSRSPQTDMVQPWKGAKRFTPTQLGASPPSVCLHKHSLSRLPSGFHYSGPIPSYSHHRTSLVVIDCYTTECFNKTVALLHHCCTGGLTLPTLKLPAGFICGCNRAICMLSAKRSYFIKGTIYRVIAQSQRANPKSKPITAGPDKNINRCYSSKFECFGAIVLKSLC